MCLAGEPYTPSSEDRSCNKMIDEFHNDYLEQMTKATISNFAKHLFQHCPEALEIKVKWALSGTADETHNHKILELLPA